MIKRYLAPMMITILLILAYMAIRYQKLGWIKVVFKTVGIVALIEALYLSLIAIVRMPISKLTIPFGLVIGMTTIVILLLKDEKKLEKIEKSEKKK